MEKPILFNTEMVRAILDGRKTVTRRVIKPQPECVRRCADQKMYGAYESVDAGRTPYMFSAYRKPPYAKGDVMWVRETWSTTDTCGLFPPWPGDGKTHYIYKAEAEPGDPIVNEVYWRPSIFMPKEAARIFLRVTDVRVERLQAITPLQAILEGISPEESIRRFKTMTCTPGDDANAQIEKQFSELWNRTIKPRDLPLYGWEANPWVWVIEFERLEDYKPNESNP